MNMPLCPLLLLLLPDDDRAADDNDDDSWHISGNVDAVSVKVYLREMLFVGKSSTDEAAGCR